MADKGGKGYSQPKGGKSALKSPAPLKGKDDSSAKSKRGRKVQFDYEDSLESKINISSKSGGKGDTLSSKGGWGKGGKGDKIANGGKSSAAKAPPPLELRIEQELPESAKCLMDCEAAQILQGIQEQMVTLSEDPTIKIPVYKNPAYVQRALTSFVFSSFDRGFQYAKSSSHYTNPQSVRRILESLKKHGVSDGEVCLMANICPESVDEVFALIPSLKGKKSKLREPLKDALSEVAKFKVST